LGVGEPYWHHFAQAGAEVSDAALQFASTGDESSFYVVVGASERLDALIEKHCAPSIDRILMQECS
jgi:hypothetical protein